MITAIVAIGRRGQLGLNGELPWHDSADLKWFREYTAGKVVIVGSATAKKLPELPGRIVVVWHRDAHPSELVKQYPDAVIIGGGMTYRAFSRYIKRWNISVVDYDGPADTWFNQSTITGHNC